MARRQPKRSSQLKRKPPQREPYDRVLIVCEGEKTEPAYFEGLKEHYGLSTANIEVTPADGTNPMSIVRYAEKLMKKEQKQGEKFDKIYCVFDRDEHQDFDPAREWARRKNMHCAWSWPCFEYWLVLHFEYCRSPFSPTQSRTSAQNCVKRLKEHFLDYEKGQKNVFSLLIEQLDTAKQHAQRAWLDAEATAEPNPSTKVHGLVEYLQTLKS